jgi:hypothetical protein
MQGLGHCALAAASGAVSRRRPGDVAQTWQREIEKEKRASGRVREGGPVPRPALSDPGRRVGEERGAVLRAPRGEWGTGWSPSPPNTGSSRWMGKRTPCP